jgi:drug/metabolite transporter (DMT)-like permease
MRSAGAALAAGGVIVLLTRGDPAALRAGGSLGTGDLLVLISALNWAVFTVLSRRALRIHTAALLMLWVMCAGWAMTAVAWAAGGHVHELFALSRAGWVAIAFLGICCSGIAYALWYGALQRLPAARVGALLYAEPIVTAVVAAYLLGEVFTLAAAVGGALILLGLLLIERPFSSPAQ